MTGKLSGHLCSVREIRTDSASLYIDLGEHGGGAKSPEKSKAKFRRNVPSDFRGKKLIFPVYR